MHTPTAYRSSSAAARNRRPAPASTAGDGVLAATPTVDQRFRCRKRSSRRIASRTPPANVLSQHFHRTITVCCSHCACRHVRMPTNAGRVWLQEVAVVVTSQGSASWGRPRERLEGQQICSASAFRWPKGRLWKIC